MRMTPEDIQTIYDRNTPRDAHPSTCYESNKAMNGMCLWEAALEDKAVYSWLTGDGDTGAWTARELCHELGGDVEIAYRFVSYVDGDLSDDRVTFDWEFCPRFLSWLAVLGASAYEPSPKHVLQAGYLAHFGQLALQGEFA